MYEYHFSITHTYAQHTCKNYSIQIIVKNILEHTEMKIQGTIQTFIKQEAHVQQISPEKIKDELTRSQRSGGHWFSDKTKSNKTCQHLATDICTMFYNVQTGEVQNVSANQRLWWAYQIFDRSKKQHFFNTNICAILVKYSIANLEKK